MELFAFAGISNSTILLTAAAVMGSAAVASVVMRALGLSSESALANRVDKLEMRTAAAGDYRAVISMATGILSGVDMHGVPHVVDMFEDAGLGSSWFGPKLNAGEAACLLVNELKNGIQVATAVAHPIQNMVDNGSIEIRRERANLADAIRKQVATLKSPTWDRHGPTILGAGVPSTTVSLTVDCFCRMQALKVSALALSRKSSADQFAGVLAQAAAVLMSAGQSVDLFNGVSHVPANVPPTATDDVVSAELPSVADDGDHAVAEREGEPQAHDDGHHAAADPQVEHAAAA